MQVPHLKFGRHNFNVATPVLNHLNLSFCNQKQIQTIALETTSFQHFKMHAMNKHEWKICILHPEKIHCIS